MLAWLLAGSTTLAAAGPRLAVLSFSDDAGFQGEWDLGQEVPISLGEHLTGMSSLDVVDADSVWAAEKSSRSDGKSGQDLAIAVGEKLQADFVVTGVVSACGIRRVVAGDPNLGGYRSFTYAIGLEDVDLTRTATATVVRTMSVVRDSVIRPLELNLFGRPTALDREFEQLLKIDFGGEEFDELKFGRYVRGALDDLAATIISTIYDRRPLILSREGARVLAVDGERVFLGIGIEDFLEVGDILPILDGEGDRVALVEVVEMIGPHLSSATLRNREVAEDLQATSESAGDSVGVIEVGHRLGQRLAPDALNQN